MTVYRHAIDYRTTMLEPLGEYQRIARFRDHVRWHTDECGGRWHEHSVALTYDTGNVIRHTQRQQYEQPEKGGDDDHLGQLFTAVLHVHENQNH